MAWRPLQVCLSTTTGCFDSSVLLQEEVTTALPVEARLSPTTILILFYPNIPSRKDRFGEKKGGGGEEGALSPIVS
ncbi:hypothetical protein T09_10996 [Trichinella sp. T9]|nr:hypothetical protein T09_10996 [Trichinella sp. T9]